MATTKNVKLTRPPAADGKVALPKVYLATPCYGRMAMMTYIQGLVYSCISMEKSGVKFSLALYGNESLITRARNKACADFMATDCTHLLFIDSDVGFKPKDVAALVMSGLDVVCGAYPMKSIGWENVVEAVNAGKPTEHLAELSALYAVNAKPEDVTGDIPVKDINGNRYIEVLDGATGFMCIRREVIERIIKECGDELAYITDYHPQGKTHYAVFETMIDPKSKRYLSEDYAFCRRWQQLGGKIHLCLDIDLTHTGTHEFRGQVARLFESTPEPTHTHDTEPSPPPDMTGRPECESDRPPPMPLTASGFAGEYHPKPALPDMPRVDRPAAMSDASEAVEIVST